MYNDMIYFICDSGKFHPAHLLPTMQLTRTSGEQPVPKLRQEKPACAWGVTWRYNPKWKQGGDQDRDTLEPQLTARFYEVSYFIINIKDWHG